MLVPRDYQIACHEALWQFLHTKHGRNPLVVEPTGTGKSLQMAMLLWHLLSKYPHVRAISLAHVQELVAGNYAELLGIWPSAPAGVYSAGLGVKDHRHQITFASIQSVAKKAALFKRIDFVLVDEAHMINDKENAQYNRFINDLRKVNPNLVVVGFTATDFRMKTGRLTEGDLFDEVAFDLSDGEAFVWLINNGYLSRPVPRHPGFMLDSDNVGVVGGDFDNKAASDAMRDQDILERAVDTCIALGVEQGRKAWLHFCQSIEDADLVADMFTYKGFPHESVHSKRSDREEVLAAFQRGELQGVTNKDILTTGYNQKNIDLIGALRLTRSPGLWVQMVGRGTRPLYAPGFDTTTVQGRLDAMLASPKQTCLVLDFVGNTERLGPINYPRVPGRRKKKKANEGALVRRCPQCDTYNHISRATCENCGHEFPPPERLKASASEAALVAEGAVLDLSQKPPPKEYRVEGVHRMVAAHHKGKGGKPDTVRVDYFCGFNRYSTWVCFAHPAGSFARSKAEQWWRQHGGQGEAPTSIDEAVSAASQLTKPKFIKVEVGGKYSSIEAYDFVGTRFELPPELGGPPLAEPGPDPTDAHSAQNDALLKKLGITQDEDIPF